MIVADANLICYFYIKGEFTLDSEQVFEKDSLWISPSLWKSEFRNVLILYLRKNIISFEEAVSFIENAENDLIHSDYQVKSSNVLDLALASGCSAYDCEYVSLAKDLNVPLVTMDKKIIKNFPDIAISMKDFVNNKS